MGGLTQWLGKAQFNKNHPQLVVHQPVAVTQVVPPVPLEQPSRVPMADRLMEAAEVVETPFQLPDSPHEAVLVLITQVVHQVQPELPEQLVAKPTVQVAGKVINSP